MTNGCAWTCSRLAGNETLRLSAGIEVRCHSGTVLVTQEGDLDDHVLEAGDACRTRPRGRVVAWALSDAELSVSPMERAGRLRAPVAQAAP